MIFRWCLLVLACALPACAQSADGVYQGMLGNQQIVVEISTTPLRFQGATQEDSYPVQGRYFYRRHGVEILLAGTPLEDGSIRFQEFERGPSRAEWRLTISGSRASGIFCKCDVRQPAPAGASPLKISLNRISTRGKAYEDQFFSFPLETASEVRVNDDIAYVIQTDSRFEAGMPHLTRFPDAAVMARINKDLARQLKSERHRAAECLSYAQQSGAEGDWEGYVEVTLLTRDILSIVHNFNSSCGGNHPNVSIEPLIYNLRTGTPFDFRDFFEVKAGKGLAQEGVVPRQRAYLPFFHLYLKHYKMLKDENKDCLEAVEDEASLAGTFEFKFYFNKDGMVLFPGMPHVIFACTEPITVSYKELGPLLKRGSPFASYASK